MTVASDVPRRRAPGRASPLASLESNGSPRHHPTERGTMPKYEATGSAAARKQKERGEAMRRERRTPDEGSNRVLALVGLNEIAKQLGVPLSTVSSWHRRNWPVSQAGRNWWDKPVKRPRCLAVVAGRHSVYWWYQVKQWAIETGRLTDEG